MKPIHIMNIKSLLAIFCIAFLVGSCSQTQSSDDANASTDGQQSQQEQSEETAALNTLTEAEKADGWKLLFDGESTDGWHNFKKVGVGSGWSIVDGALSLDPSKEDGGDIISKDQFENFELMLEWKIGKCGNSGIFYNVVEAEKYSHAYLTGPEMQVLDNTCHPDGENETHRAGDLYDLIKCSEETVKPAGEWNLVKIKIDNGKLEHWLNGVKVVETEMWTDAWKEMVANSKFKDMPDFGTAKKGHIALQDHSDPVAYRNIKVKEL